MQKVYEAHCATVGTDPDALPSLSRDGLSRLPKRALDEEHTPAQAQAALREKLRVYTEVTNNPFPRVFFG